MPQTCSQNMRSGLFIYQWWRQRPWVIKTPSPRSPYDPHEYINKRPRLGTQWTRENHSFPGGSGGKASVYNAGDEPLHFTSLHFTSRHAFRWASLVALLVKNPPAMWETWIQSLGWEDPLEEGTASHSSILPGESPKDRGAWHAAVNGVAKSWTRLSDWPELMYHP